jgi:hypothetical protein
MHVCYTVGENQGGEIEMETQLQEDNNPSYPISTISNIF